MSPLHCVVLLAVVQLSCVVYGNPFNGPLAFLQSVPECEDPELEAAVTNAVNLIVNDAPLGTMALLQASDFNSDVIHSITCFYNSVHSLQDLAPLIPAPYQQAAFGYYHQFVHYFNAAGGHDGISQFLYELHELLTYLTSIDFPNQPLGSVQPIDSWKFFTQLQLHQSPVWDMASDFEAYTGDVVLLKFMTWSPEKLARILYTTTGMSDLSVALEAPAYPIPALLVDQMSNAIVAELEIWNLLIERGWLDLH